MADHIQTWGRLRLGALILVMVTVFSATDAFGQCKPASQQYGDQHGCWVLADQQLGQPPQEPLFWHLHLFPTRAEAEAAKGPGGTVLQVFEKVWLSTIAGANWKPEAGTRVAKIGPLPGISNENFIAHYMETITDPGNSTSIHRHAGPEVWYTLTGEVCLETPEGVATGHAGESTIAPAGTAMRGTTIGSETRRSLVLVLHKTSEPWFSPAPDWVPKGLCKP